MVELSQEKSTSIPQKLVSKEEKKIPSTESTASKSKISRRNLLLGAAITAVSALISRFRSADTVKAASPLDGVIGDSKGKGREGTEIPQPDLTTIQPVRGGEEFADPDEVSEEKKKNKQSPVNNSPKPNDDVKQPEPTPTVPDNKPVQPSPSVTPTPSEGPRNESNNPRTPENIVKLKKELENKYNIYLIGSEEHTAFTINRERFDFDAYPETQDGWDFDQLYLIDQVLSQLPKAMYGVNVDAYGNQDKIAIALIDKLDHRGTFERFQRYKIGNISLIIGRKADLTVNAESVNNMRFVGGVITHELTHRANRENSKYDPRVDKIFKDVFQQPFEDVRPSLYNRVGELLEQQNLPLEDKIYLERLQYGLTPTLSPDELVAVHGEFYTRGKDYFFNMGNKYLNPDVVRGMYAVMKDIFDGKEYDKPMEFIPSKA